MDKSARQVGSHTCGQMHRQRVSKQLDLRTDRRTTGLPGGGTGRGHRAPEWQGCPAEVPLLAQAIHCRGVTS